MSTCRCFLATHTPLLIMTTAYGLYAAAAVISLLFVRFAVHETKNRTLEEM